MAPSSTPPSGVARGVYRLSFAVAAYFAGRGSASFFPEVQVVFEIVDTSRHYHVPLLLSPYGYSTYRGS
jgi:5-hydroxyisourate hydrolase